MQRAADVGRAVGMTVALSWLDAEAAIGELYAAGFEGVEVHVAQIAPSLPGVPVAETHAAAVGDLLRGHGLVVSSLNAAGAPGFEPVAGDRDEAAATLAAQLRLAAALGAPRLLCWDGRSGAGAADAPARLAAVVESALERSRLTLPPEVSVELHPFTFALATGVVAETAAALAGVGAGVCVDFCHFAVALGPDFVLDDDLLAATTHVHLSDGDGASSELHFPLGAGALDLDALVERFAGREVCLAWDLFSWPAPRDAVTSGMQRYRELVARHAETLEAR